MVKIKAIELIGPSLDWAVAKCEGEKYQAETVWDGIGNEHLPHRYSTDWDQAGKIIEQNDISIVRVSDYFGVDRRGFATSKRIPVWCAAAGQRNLEFSTEHQSHDAMFQIYEDHVVYGPSALIAAMRVHVLRTLGPVVEVPDELSVKIADENSVADAVPGPTANKGSPMKKDAQEVAVRAIGMWSSFLLQELSTKEAEITNGYSGAMEMVARFAPTVQTAMDIADDLDLSYDDVFDYQVSAGMGMYLRRALTANMTNEQLSEGFSVELMRRCETFFGEDCSELAQRFMKACPSTKVSSLSKNVTAALNENSLSME